ncbi:MAG TPA: 50S ribosomal protein L11 methyltransferase [Fodinibius sp.]|nr:50S ribosomal protein L11 methyltransferase [Fodinibius sp.]
MKYIKLVIAINDEYQEPFIAELSEMGFDGFEQFEDQLVTYIEQGSIDIGDRERIEQLLAGFPRHGFIESEQIVREQNWNEQWEQTIRARQIGRFFVKPTWSAEQAPQGKILLEIDPKMSFGTGYHETTRLMLQLLPDLVGEGDRVIDAGTGTGILAIAAIKLGAGHAVAFDIDEWSINNARENILLNGVSSRITIKQGSAEVLSEQASADLLLANIKRDIILELLPDFTAALKKEGHLVLSGLLESDRRDIEARLSPLSEIKNIRRENKWIAIHAQLKK